MMGELHWLGYTAMKLQSHPLIAQESVRFVAVTGQPQRLDPRSGSGAGTPSAVREGGSLGRGRSKAGRNARHPPRMRRPRHLDAVQAARAETVGQGRIGDPRDGDQDGLPASRPS